MPAERRRHPRYSFARHLQVRGDPPVGRFVAEVRDVSERGVSFVTDVRLSVGELVVIGLRHDAGFLVEATVRNVRVEDGHYVVGVERTSGVFGRPVPVSDLAARRTR
jgi:PilZ domain